MEENMIALLNNIREESSDFYKSIIPEATRKNLDEIQFILLNNDNKAVITNELIRGMINKVAKVKIHNKFFENPLKPLKKGAKPLGDSIEEIYANFIKSDQDAFVGENLLKRNLPDIKTVYHRKNYESQYTVSINKKKIKYAFSSFENLDAFVTSIIQAAYNSLELAEFLNMKELFRRASENNAIVTVKVPDPLKSKKNAEDFITIVKTVSRLMKYPKGIFNAYNKVQKTDPNQLITLSRNDEQVLILPEHVDVKVDVSVLANSFNMSLTDFNSSRKMNLDTFPVANCVGALIDEQFMQVHDDDLDVTEFFNAKSRYYNYYINNEQTMSYSPLVNAVLFVTGEDADIDGLVEDFTVTYDIVETASSTNKIINVIEGTEYKTTISGEFVTVTVTMGGNDITSTAYNSTTKEITIPKITGDIEIAVSP